MIFLIQSHLYTPVQKNALHLERQICTRVQFPFTQALLPHHLHFHPPSQPLPFPTPRRTIHPLQSPLDPYQIPSDSTAPF